MSGLSFVCATNSRSVLEANLLRSPCLSGNSSAVWLGIGFDSAGKAYNTGLDNTCERYCVFVHQDVYLPRGWVARLLSEIEALERRDPQWAVLGLYGVDYCGRRVGRVWSSGLGREIGERFSTVIAVQSVDELVIVLKRSTGLRFDEALPGFHMYGTDIVQEAIKSGFGAYVVHAPVVHNSTTVRSLFGGFLRAYDYMRRKWSAQLPLYTPVIVIQNSLYLSRFFVLKRYLRYMIKGRKMQSTVDPEIVSRDLFSS